MKTSEYISAEDFDREYGLADLLPTATVEEILKPLGRLAKAAIVQADGVAHFGAVSVAPDCLQALFATNAAQSSSVLLFATNEGKMAACPLLHEMELIGLLLIQSEGRHADVLLPTIAQCLAASLNRMMYTVYQNKLTFGLHAQVVMESYDQLKRKADQLEKSEARYRGLAKNLEVEVQRKTKEIRETQLLLMQREKLASVGQLAAGMAHEINNPIGFLISNLNTLKDCFEGMATLIQDYERLVHLLCERDGNREADHSAKHLMAKIDLTRAQVDIDYILEDGAALIRESMDGGQRIQTIVQNLRDFTHPSIMAAEKVDINSCIDSTLAVLENHIPGNVTITKAYQPIPAITCYLREINQAFYHILHNALLAVDDQGRIIIRTQTTGPHAEIIVSDNGQGIDEADLPRIFDPFFTTRDVGQGTGLGLHTAYNFVQKHGGTISVESCIGHGSTFTVQLPLEQTPHMNEKTEKSVKQENHVDIGLTFYKR